MKGRQNYWSKIVSKLSELNCVWYAIISSNDEIVVKQITATSVERRKQKEFVIEAVALTLFELISSIKS